MANYNKLPQKLTENKNFGIYRLTKTDGVNGHKYSKFPLHKVNDPSQWITFNEALKQVNEAEQAGGECGFLLAYFLNGDGIHCLDLDNIGNEVQECRNEYVSQNNIIRRVIMLLGHTYTEYSSSENGVHIFFRTDSEVPHKQRSGSIELYGDKRGIALTGNTLFGESWPVKTISVETYKQLIKMLGLEQPKEKPHAAAAVISKHRSTQAPNNWTEQDAWNSLEHDRVYGSLIADVIRGAASYTVLDNDHSNAELKVCNCLAYHTRGNADLMYNMLINSPLITNKDIEKGHYTDYKNLTLLEVRIIDAVNRLRSNANYSDWIA